MAIDLVTRAQWGARAPKGSYSTLRSTEGVKVHYTGGRVDPGIVGDHDRCVLAVRAIQRMHMDGNGWMDIGYSMVACPHRKVFVGRGPKHLPAANGPGLNTGHYAVLGLVGNAGLVEPTDGLLLGILDAIAYLREHGGAGAEIRGHRDGYATDCPGGPLYAWVKRGAPRPGVTSPKGPSKEDLVSDLPLLREGDENWDVKTLRALLVARGGRPEDLNLLSPLFDAELGDFVEAFQRREKLVADRVVGPVTWRSLLRLS